MKTIKRLLSLVLLAICGLSLVACDFNNIISTANKVKSEAIKSATGLVDGIDKDGHFEEDRSYTVAYSHTDKDNVTVTISLNLQFKKDGKFIYVDQENNETINYTYKIEDGLIKCYQESNLIRYYYYYEDVVVEASVLLLCGTRDGVTVSERGTGTLGYVAYIMLNVGDTKSALTTDKSNENMYYTIRKNGTLSSTGKRVVADQLGLFDTSEAKRYATTLTVGTGSSAKKCPVIVLVA
ncbi:MAG: hypothetical protein K6F59_04200 [Gammaproteobacteria bacterium]|nr:hypothetical protein [Gammaproteobacteria bacterium]